MLTDFQCAAQAWECTLFASGGILALHKCYWWIVAWRLDNRLTEMVTAEDYPITLKLTNGNDPAAVTTTRLGPDDANVGLGFRMAQDYGLHLGPFELRNQHVHHRGQGEWW